MSWRFALCALCGLLVGRAQWAGYGALAFFALAPAFVALHRAAWLQAAAAGSLIGVFGALHLYGIAAYGLRLWLGLIAYCGVSTALVSVLFVLAARGRQGRGAWPPLALALAWVVGEWARGLGPISFPTSLGGTQASFTSLLQLCALVGESGLSLLLAWLGAALGQRLLLRDGSARSFRWLLLGTLIVIACGALRVWRAPAVPGNAARVVGIQAGAPPWLYRVAPFEVSLAEAMQERYAAATRKAFASGAAAVLWPEHAFWDTVADEPTLRALTRALAREAGRPLVFASTRRLGPGRRLSSALVAAPSGELRPLHDKSQLAPIVEAQLSPGEHSRPLALPGAEGLGAVGLLICVESLYPDLGRELALAGADWLAVLTNDAGFLRSPIAQIHADRAVVRAVAAGRSLLRVAQSGVSLATDPYGRVQERLGLFEQGQVTLRLAPPIAVPARYFGGLVGPGALLLLGLGVALSRRAAR